MTNVERIRKELSPARRKKVEARAAQLIGEEMNLQELRQARKLTQVRMAKALGIRKRRGGFGIRRDCRPYEFPIG